MNPARELDCDAEVAGKVSTMDRLMMSSSVAHKHEIGHVTFDFAAPVT